MRFFGNIVSLVALMAGLGAIALGWSRYRLPYEDGRYFDPQMAVVYHQQTAEVYLIAGVALTVVGLVLAFISFRRQFLRSR